MHLVAFLERNGVSDRVQGALISKANAGIAWDSMNGSTPVSTSVTTTATLQHKVSTYADGSIVVEGMEIPVESKLRTISPFYVGNCKSVSSGSGYANRYDCQAYAESGFISLGTYISYTLVQGGYDRILDVHSPFRSAAVGTASKPTVTITQKTENSAYRATAKIKTQYTAYVGAGSRTYELGVYVGADSAWTQWITPK